MQSFVKSRVEAVAFVNGLWLKLTVIRLAKVTTVRLTKVTFIGHGKVQ